MYGVANWSGRGDPSPYTGVLSVTTGSRSAPQGRAICRPAGACGVDDDLGFGDEIALIGVQLPKCPIGLCCEIRPVTRVKPLLPSAPMSGGRVCARAWVSWLGINITFVGVDGCRRETVSSDFPDRGAWPRSRDGVDHRADRKPADRETPQRCWKSCIRSPGCGRARWHCVWR